MQEALERIEAIRQRFVRPPYQTLAQVALAFVLANPDVSAAIPGAGTPAELADNMAVNTLPPLSEAAAHELMTAGAGLAELLGKKLPRPVAEPRS